MSSDLAAAPPQTSGRSREVMYVLPALMLAFLLAILDNFIVGTAMPTIVRDLGGLSHLSWVVTAYVLGTSVSTPLWGKIGDMYGRKGVFLVSIAGFLVGSALSGASQTMTELIGFRALQGLFAGGLAVGAMAIIGDLVPPRERGRYQGIMSGVMAIAMVAGPLAGGYITDNLSWRWAFYVNLPLGAIALVMVTIRLHLPKKRTDHRIDWWGSAFLAIAITGLVLLTTWGGTQYAWGSWQILGLGILSVASLVIFGFVEPRAAEPVLSLQLFKNRNFALVSLMGFLVGFAMFGVLSFLPLYQQTVQGASATNSGLLLLPMMGGLLVSSLTAGQLITKTGKYKVFPIIGGIGMTIGMALLSTIGATTARSVTAVFMIVLGLGMGFLMQTTMLIAQNSVQQKDIGVASSAATFFRSIGGSFGVAMFGAIFNHRLFSYLVGIGQGQLAEAVKAGGASTFSAASHVKLPVPLLDGIATATSTIFFWATFLAVLVPILAAFVQQIALRGRNDPPPDAEAETQESLADAESLVVAYE